MALLPAAIYFVLFVVVTYPMMLQFATHFFSDRRDGLIMIWNIWWTNKAVTDLHQSPWFTTYLYYPTGVSLLLHTLCPFNGFLGVLLLPLLSLVQTYNFIIVFSYVVGGLTAFWLTLYVSRAWWPSIVGGFVFSFSNYHFAHTLGHLNLVALEWLPLFLLCWYALLLRPRLWLALAAAATLFAVVLCDYYYFFYCVLAAVVVFVWRAVRAGRPFLLLRKPHLVSLSVFAVAVLASSGVMIMKVIAATRYDTYEGHAAAEFSADLLSPFVYGAIHRFSHLTEGYWRALPGNIGETSVYVGLSVIALIVVVWLRRRRLEIPSLSLWYILLLFFLVCSFGPRLQVWGRVVPYVPMPYQLLELVFPYIELSGVPSRMNVMVMLAAGVIAAVGLDVLWRAGGRARWVVVGLVALIFVEFLPFKMRPYRIDTPASVALLKDLPDDGSVLNAAYSPYQMMYYQTVFDKPSASGKIARLPKSVKRRFAQTIQIAGPVGDKERLREYEVRYILMSDSTVFDLKANKTYRAVPVSTP